MGNGAEDSKKLAERTVIHVLKNFQVLGVGVMRCVKCESTVSVGALYWNPDEARWQGEEGLPTLDWYRICGLGHMLECKMPYGEIAL